MAAPSTSSSYSALLRRSKLAAFTPSVEQVYTTSPGNLARANWGLKRPLPQASTTTSPFVRLFDLDSGEGRTTFRKATREALFTKKWQEVGVGLASEAHRTQSRGSNANSISRPWDRLPVQSRFVDGSAPGAIRNVPTDGGAAPAQQPRMPNFFAMDERDFERFLSDLGDRRDEFAAFVLRESKNAGSNSAAADDFDLYAHAQRKPLELIRLVERFLRLPSSTSPAPAAASAAPFPQVHPTLALQYSSPTPLESALSAPIPGRLLGPSPDMSSRSSGSVFAQKGEVFASVLSQVTPVAAPATAGVASTSFFPDATGERSNAPGRAHFRLQAPVIKPIPYASRTSILRNGVRKSADFRPATAEYEPSALALRAIDLRATVVPPAQVAQPRPLPGTPAYSGDQPPELARRGARASSLTDLYGGGPGSYKSLGVRGAPQNLLAAKGNRRTSAQHEAWIRQREALVDQNGKDAQLYARKEDDRKGGKVPKKTGPPRPRSKNEQKKQLMDRLNVLLNESK